MNLPPQSSIEPARHVWGDSRAAARRIAARGVEGKRRARPALHRGSVRSCGRPVVIEARYHPLRQCSDALPVASVFRCCAVRHARNLAVRGRHGKRRGTKRNTQGSCVGD